MKEWVTLLLLVQCLALCSVADSCTRCRAFDLTISCEEQTNLVTRKYNGYMCAAKTGANVVLNCTLDDIDGLTVEYEWWKSNTVEGKSFGSQMAGAQQISNCTTASCQLNDVKWTSSNDVGEHDSQFYQCVAKATLNDKQHVFYSNVIAVDVQSYIEAGTATSGSVSVDTKTPETKLECTVPTTNPASEVVWKYITSNGSSEVDAETLSNVLVVREEIKASDAKYGYKSGMLVIMDFKASDAGTYKCLVKYTDEFGNVNQAAKSSYAISSSGITKTSVSEQLLLVSQVQGPAFLYADTDSTKLQCLASNLNAGVSAKHYWQKSEVVDGLTVYKNISSNYTLTNQNRTLIVSKNYALTDSQFRCQVMKGANELLLNGFLQSPILPKTSLVPSSLSCKTNGSAYEASISDLLTNDISQSGVSQILAGSSYYWNRNGDAITKFTDGYSVSSDKLGFTINADKQCDYVQQTKYYSGIYSIQQIFSLSVYETISEVTPTIASLQTSGSDKKTITCTGGVTSFGTALNNKIGVSIMFDVSGCTEYMTAVSAWSDVKGTCGISTSRWVTIDRAKLCSNCVIKCYAVTGCKESIKSSITIEPKMVLSNANDSVCSVCGGDVTGTYLSVCDNDVNTVTCSINGSDDVITNTTKTTCEGTTEKVSSDMPSWGVALIVIVVILGLLAISAVFFYTYMEKIQANSDSKILGAAVLKVNNFVGKKPEPETESPPIFTMPNLDGIGNIFKREEKPVEKKSWWKRLNPFKKSPPKEPEPDI